VSATDFDVPASCRYSSRSEHVVSVGFGSLAERIYGRGIYLAIYLIAGLTGAILGIAWHPFTVVAGASGAIFGIAGALLACFYFGEPAFPSHAVKALLLSLVAFTTYNLLLGILNPPADNAAHFGGLPSASCLASCCCTFPFGMC
jgi:rhomboid protease GluP